MTEPVSAKVLPVYYAVATECKVSLLLLLVLCRASDTSGCIHYYLCALNNRLQMTLLTC